MRRPPSRQPVATAIYYFIYFYFYFVMTVSGSAASRVQPVKQIMATTDVRYARAVHAWCLVGVTEGQGAGTRVDANAVLSCAGSTKTPTCSRSSIKRGRVCMRPTQNPIPTLSLSLTLHSTYSTLPLTHSNTNLHPNTNTNPSACPLSLSCAVDQATRGPTTWKATATSRSARANR